MSIPTWEPAAGQLTQCAIACHDEKDGVWPSDHLGVYAELRTDPAPEPQ
jgi:hypothetical protein